MSNKAQAGGPRCTEQTNPSGLSVVVCTWPLPREEEKNEAEGKLARETKTGRAIPEAPLILPVVFPGCVERSLLVGVGSRHEASEGSSPRSDSTTLDGVCLCPRDRIASACVWGTLSDDSVCVIYELWKGCISSTRGRLHGKWRNSEFINIQ